MVKMIVCLHAQCAWSGYKRVDDLNTRRHMTETDHKDFKIVDVPPGLLREKSRVYFDGKGWTIDEATLDSAIFDNHIDGTQSAAVRVLLVRKP